MTPVAPRTVPPEHSGSEQARATPSRDDDGGATFSALLGRSPGAAGMASSAPQGMAREAGQTVERFNEHGFFAREGAVAGERSPPPARVDAASSPGRDVAPASTVAGEVASGPRAFASARAISHVLPTPIEQSRLRQPSITTGETVLSGSGDIALDASDPPVADDLATTGPTRPVRAQRALHSRNAASAAQVALHDVGQGLRLLVRVGRLDPRERARLDREVSALLARHGLSSCDVVVKVLPRHGRIS